MTRALALLSCAICFLFSPLAAAKPRVALTQIEGDANGDVRDAVAQALEGNDLLLIGSREVNRAVDKLGDVAELTEKDFKKLATELEADAIVAGKLGKAGASRTLKFRLYVHNKMAQGFTMSFKDPTSEKFRTLLHDKMLTKIGVTPGSGGADEAVRKKPVDEEEDLAAKKPKKTKLAKAEDEEVKPTKKTKLGKARAEQDEEEARPAKKTKLAKAEEDEEEARPAKKTKAAKLEDEEEARPAKKTKLVKADKAEDEEAPRKAKRKIGDLDDSEGEDARPAKKVASDDADEEAPRKAKRKIGDLDDSEDGEATKPASDDEDAPRKARKQVAAADDGASVEAAAAPRRMAERPANQAAAWVDLGPSVVQRSLTFTTSAFTNQPRNVSLPAAFGARFDGEVYPLALSDRRGALAGLGIGVEFDKPVNVNLTVTDPGTMTSATEAIKQIEYSVGARYRLAFGSSETSPTLTLGVGYGKRLFSVDRSKLTTAAQIAVSQRDTPETEFTMFNPGLTFRMPVTRAVAVAVGGRGLIITDAGPIQRATSYGRTQVYGAEGTAAVEVLLGRRFAVRLSGEFIQVGFSFKGGGALSNGLDNNQATKDVGGLADRTIGGSATLAVIY